jgi:hypothetical protein
MQPRLAVSLPIMTRLTLLHCTFARICFTHCIATAWIHHDCHNAHACITTAATTATTPHAQWVTHIDDERQVIVAERGPLLFVFNFSPFHEYEDLK